MDSWLCQSRPSEPYMYSLASAYGFRLVSFRRITLQAGVLIQPVSPDNAIIGNPSIGNVLVHSAKMSLHGETSPFMESCTPCLDWFIRGVYHSTPPPWVDWSIDGMYTLGQCSEHLYARSSGHIQLNLICAANRIEYCTTMSQRKGWCLARPIISVI
jgi:hypothetical protein